MARTKIVCTLGPASRHSFTLRSMIRAGMDVARLNFSHGTHAEHRAIIRKVRRLAEEENRPVAVLADLAGPKIRIGRVRGGEILRPGRHVHLTSKNMLGTAQRLSVNRPELVPALKKGDKVMIWDGKLQLEVLAPGGEEAVCRVVTGGALKDNAGLNLPDSNIAIPSLTEKDKKDLAFCIREDIDFIGLSFVRSAEDIELCRKEQRRRKGEIPIIAKMEKSEAVTNLESIIESADGVMVARGDLGIEIPLEKVPIVQKRIITCANRRGKPVITATEMLLSMISAARPTRAEAGDVANAILDGTDAVMLSEETAVGRHPASVIRVMERIALETESDLMECSNTRLRTDEGDAGDVAHAIARTAVSIADEVNATLIISPTDSGDTPRRLVRYRPKLTVIALSTSPRTVRRLALSWGVVPWKISRRIPPDKILTTIRSRILASGLGHEGDLVVLAAGYPFGAKTSTGRVIQTEVL